ncbi:MAG TPA: hypothetical protein DCR93_03990 [Cytophagales bacterium]|nr:hypothetical protein [Cytophagales bacterium]HAP58694.1 hypothetical protein [Cytophagales bacterium]
MKKGIIAASLVAVVLASGCSETVLPTDYFSSPVPEVRQTQIRIPLGDFRDYRYCEVLTEFDNDGETVNEVYATIGCNKCPEEKWSEISAETLRVELGADSVYLNGPRYWVVNKIFSGQNVQYDKVAEFGGIQMKLAAQIRGELIQNEYEEEEVIRWTTYEYHEGNRVYKLVNEFGEEYIMQSYSQMWVPDQTIEDLESLGSRLSLPQGWRFETEVLGEDFELITEGRAVVLIDDFNNTYQKIVN